MSGAATEAVQRELRNRLDYRYREIVEESGIDTAVAYERGYYLEKTKAGLRRIGFKRNQDRAPGIVIPRYAKIRNTGEVLEMARSFFGEVEDPVTLPDPDVRDPMAQRSGEKVKFFKGDWRRAWPEDFTVLGERDSRPSGSQGGAL